MIDFVKAEAIHPVSQKIYQAVLDLDEDRERFMTGAALLPKDIKERYKADLLLIHHLLEEIGSDEMPSAKLQLASFIALTTPKFTPRRTFILSDYNRTGTGTYPQTQLVITALSSALYDLSEKGHGNLIIENLFLLAFQYPEEIRLTELIMSIASNPDIFFKANIQQNGKIKNFLRLMSLHPSSQVRSWAALGLGYFAGDLEVRNLLLQINSDEEVSLTFNSKEQQKAKDLLAANKDLNVFENPQRTKAWLTLFESVYLRWGGDIFKNKIQDYYDYDREYSVIRAAGTGLLWKALPNKQSYLKKSRTIYARNGLPHLLISSANSEGLQSIPNPPNSEKLEVSPGNIWILADLPSHKIDSAFASTLADKSILIPYGTRSTILGFLKYKILQTLSSQSFLQQLLNFTKRILGTNQHSPYANVIPLQPTHPIDPNFNEKLNQVLYSTYPSKKPEVNIRSKFFAIRALILFGEHQIARNELDNISTDVPVPRDLLIDWRETLQWTYGNQEGMRKFILTMNRKLTSTCSLFF